MKLNEISFKLEHDTLDTQIDRLNTAIQSIMSDIHLPNEDISLEKLTPDGGSISYDRNRSRVYNKSLASLDELDYLISNCGSPSLYIENDEDAVSRIENMILNLDRSIMTCEDYRSHELRKNECDLNDSISFLSPEFRDKSFSYFESQNIDISLNDIYRLNSDTQKIISECESYKSYHGNLSFNNINFDVSIKHSDFIIPPKLDLSRLVSDSLPIKNSIKNSKNVSQLQAYINQLENEIEDLKSRIVMPKEIVNFGKVLEKSVVDCYKKLQNVEIEESFEKSFTDHTSKFQKSFKSFTNKDMIRFKKFKSEHSKIKEELE